RASSTSRRAVESRRPRARTTAVAASRSGASANGTALCARVMAIANACNCDPTPLATDRQTAVLLSWAVPGLRMGITITSGAIPSPPTNVLHVGPLAVHVYGLCYALAVLAAVAIVRRRWE